jgi:hypothetical protein
LAETLTDADGTGTHVLTGNYERDEIADVCNYLYKTINGHAEQAYWSNAAHRCVIPTGSSSLGQPPQPRLSTRTQHLKNPRATADPTGGSFASSPPTMALPATMD